MNGDKRVENLDTEIEKGKNKLWVFIVEAQAHLQ